MHVTSMNSIERKRGDGVAMHSSDRRERRERL